MDLLQLMSNEEWAGFRPLDSETRPPDWMDRVDRLTELVRRDGKWTRIPHRRWELALYEAMTTADFPLVFGDSLYRQMVARYEGLTPPLSPIVQEIQLPDFRTGKIFRIDGTTQRLQIVGEIGEYGQKARYETRYQLTIAKYGAGFDLSWESFVNDDLGIFDAVPADMADSARNTEAWLVSSLFWGATGAQTAYFAHVSEGQMGVSALALTLSNLQTACSAMRGATAGFRNRQGEPFLNRPGFLVTCPALEYTARQILNSTEVRNLDDTVRTTIMQGQTVGAMLGLTLIVDPWIPVITTTGTVAQTCWAVFSATVKPAALGKLRGRPAPELFMKAPDQERVGGAPATVWDGDFDRDAIKYKVRHPLGAVTLDPRGGWASNGQ